MKSRNVSILSIVIAVSIPLAGCSGAVSDANAGNENEQGSVQAGLWSTADSISLRDDTKKACQDIWSGSAEDRPNTGDLIVVVDRTAGLADQPLPQGLQADIIDASKTGGLLSVISVEGEGKAPVIMAKHVPLNTSGPLDRPSVKEVAQIMPDCVASELLSRNPEAQGSDIYSALAASAELATAKSKLWLLSDSQFNAGPVALSPDLLAVGPEKAAKIVSAAASLDFEGAEWNQAGLANSTMPLSPVNRKWLKTFTASICKEWKASGCTNTELTPVNPQRSSTGKLLEDKPLQYPASAKKATAAGCTFDVPGSLMFEENSYALRDGYEIELEAPVALAKAEPSSTVLITAHTASVPGISTQDLKKFSKRRGLETGKVFLNAGIADERIVINGVGDTNPLEEDIDPVTGRQIEAAAARERRVDILIKGAPCLP